MVTKLAHSHSIAKRSMRICADCGFRDTAPIPPPMCPQCHNNPGSPLAPVNAISRMNRHDRRAHEKKQRIEQRRVQRQLDRKAKEPRDLSDFLSHDQD